MGLILSSKDAKELEKIALRERAPFYIVGEVTNDHHFSFYSKSKNETQLTSIYLLFLEVHLNQ